MLVSMLIINVELSNEGRYKRHRFNLQNGGREEEWEEHAETFDADQKR